MMHAFISDGPHVLQVLPDVGVHAPDVGSNPGVHLRDVADALGAKRMRSRRVLRGRCSSGTPEDREG
jgi:hypothetical protein